MLALLDASKKQAKASLYSDEPMPVPDWEHGESVPITAGRISRIASPITARLFEPQDLTGWTMRAALGKGFLAPVAGVWFILSGINLTSGLLTTGRRYKIVTYVAGDSFTNVGAASNATGVIFTASGTTPTTWTNSSILQEATTNLDFDATEAEIQAALDAAAWVVAAGGLTVDGATGFFYFTFTTAGTRSQMTGDVTNLAPLSIADFSTLIDGTTQLAEVQTVRILQNPGAYISLTVANDSAAAGAQTVQVGGSGLNAKYRVSLTTRQSGTLISGARYTIVLYVAGDDFVNVGGTNVTGNSFVASGTTPTTWSNKSTLQRTDAPQPYDGQFTITVRGLESEMINFDASAADVMAALEGITITSGLLTTGAKYKIVSYLATDDFTNVGAASNETGVVFTASGTTPTDWVGASILSPVAEGNVSVSKEAEGQWLLAFQGDMANTAMGTLTADGSSLRVVQTLSGNLSLATAAIDIMLAGESSTAVVFEIEGTPPGGAVQKLFRQDCTLRDSIIDPSSTTPPVNADGNAYIGAYARFVPIAGGMKIQVSTDGITWQDGPSYVAS